MKKRKIFQACAAVKSEQEGRGGGAGVAKRREEDGILQLWEQINSNQAYLHPTLVRFEVVFVTILL